MKKTFIGLLMFGFPLFASAQITSINSQTGASQTIVGDGLNIDVSSTGNITTVSWTGILDAIGGGTGVDMTSFNPGSLLFWDGSEIAEDNSNLFWDNSNNSLGLGGDIIFVNEGTSNFQRLMYAADQTVMDTNGNSIVITGAKGLGSGNGGQLEMRGGDAGATGIGGDTQIVAGAGGSTSGSAGAITLEAGAVTEGRGGNVTIRATAGSGTNQDGGDLEFYTGDRIGSGTPGKFYFFPRSGNATASILDFNSVTTSIKTFTFPDATGTLSLIESDQEFSGINTFSGNNVFSGDNELSGINTFSNPVNNFISSTDSTVHIGDDGIPGCIVMGDDDSSGVTYVTANDGVLSATTSPPANCN